MKDLSAYAAPTLDINLGRGRKVSITPPSAEDGAKLGALVTLGAAVATNDVNATVQAMAKTLLEDYDDPADLARLALGNAYDQMISEGWPGKDIETVQTYATYYWTFGEETADQILDSKERAPRGKDRRRGRNGHRTA